MFTSRYTKGIVAMLGAALITAATALPEGTPKYITQVAVAILTAMGVLHLPNTPDPTALTSASLKTMIEEEIRTFSGKLGG